MVLVVARIVAQVYLVSNIVPVRMVSVWGVLVTVSVAVAEVSNLVSVQQQKDYPATVNYLVG